MLSALGDMVSKSSPTRGMRIEIVYCDTDSGKYIVIPHTGDAV